MSFVPLLGLLLGSTLAGTIAWRRATTRMFYRSGNPTIRESHVSQEEYDASVLARRRRIRLLKTVGMALVGAAVGWLLATMVGAGIARE